MKMVLYRTEDDNVTVSALIKDETIWLTQKAMAELFGIDKSGISRHLAKIFETGKQTIPTNYYNLDAIISVGCRVNSIQTTKFLLYTKMAHSILTLNKSTNLFLHTHSQT